MKKQLFAVLFGITFISTNVLAYYGPNDKSNKPNNKQKGANCSPAKITCKPLFFGISDEATLACLF